MKKLAFLLVTHGAALAVGFAIGVYTLPILSAPPGPSAEEVSAVAGGAQFKGEFRRDLAGSDLLHWGEGEVSVSPQAVALMGAIAPGPAYRLYLAPEFVETEAAFMAVRDRSVAIGDIKTFENFVVQVPATVDIARYDTVVVWCEAFSEFITAARYR